MSERWKRELSKIDALEPGDGLLERAQRGPTRGEPGPSRSSRTLTIAVAFAAVAVAGFIVVRAFGLPGSGTQVASDVSPTAVIDAGPMPWMAVLKQQPRSEMEALYSGKLEERNGCLMMGDGQTLPVWPTQFWMMQSDGKTFVMDEQGRAVGALGEDMRMGGGQVPWRNNLEDLQQTLAEPIPQSCLEDLRNVWMVGETHPLAPTLTTEMQGQLLDLARKFAEANGDPKFVRTYAVVTDATKLDSLGLGLFAGADPVPGERWVLVQMLGDFTSYPPGTTEDRKGSALWFVMPLTDPLPGQATDWGVVTVPLDLKQLGDPVQIDLVPTETPPLEAIPGSLAPSVGKISCTTGGVVLGTPVVAAQRDGVTLEIDNPAGVESVGLFPEDSDATWGISTGRQRPLVQSLPPGRYVVACGNIYLDGPQDAIGATARLSVVDPASLWHPYAPECSAKPEMSQAIYADGSSVEGDRVIREPGLSYTGVDWVRIHVPGLADTDVLDYGGYPDKPEPKGSTITDGFRVVREGVVVARIVIDYYLDQPTVLVWVQACADSGIHAET